MDLHIRLEGRRRLSRQIHDALRSRILDGRLRGGDRLPPTRELAGRLGVSRNTVSLAYEWLVSEGLISGRTGAGSFVARAPVARSRARAATAIRHRAVWDRAAARVQVESTPLYDFTAGVPDAEHFPFDAWRRLLAKQIRASRLDAQYGDPAGHPALREAIARHVAVSRGVDAEPEDIIVTAGAQQAFDLIARVLIEPGDRVAVEEPGYPPPRLLFQSMGATIVPVPVGDDGLDAGALPPTARLVYVTPSHQFPLGMPMSHERRTALLAWAARRNAVIIEDDYDSEFRFGGRPLETLQSLDRSGRVVYVGSFSKSLLPALRLGFLIAPPSLRRQLRAAAYVASCFAQWPAQSALASLIDSGLLARHIRRMRRIYAERHDLILRTLTARFAEWLDPVPSVTGMHLTARLRSGRVTEERDLARRALARGVRFDRLSKYCASAPQSGLVLGYGAIGSGKIEEALRRLRACFVR